jgi:transcriptional regulator with XRE-family HTH domain
MSQKDFAAALHISPGSISMIETGKTPLIHYDRINRIAEVLGEDPDNLIAKSKLTQTFNDKVENGYTENLYAENKELVQTLKDELCAKNAQLIAKDNQLAKKDIQLEKLMDIINKK